MSTRDSRDAGGQERAARRTDQAEDAPEVEGSAAVAARKAELDADVDAMLDEIDEVLEQNSEEFVKSFVQKGGQ